MLSLMDFLVQIERRRMSLTRTGQERLAQLADSKHETDKGAKAEGNQPLEPRATGPVRCCPEAIS